MSACLRCGQLGGNGLFCNQCHSSLVYRFQKRWHQSEDTDISQLKTTTSTHNSTMSQFVKRSPFSFTLHRLFVTLIALVVIVFVADTILVTLVFSRYQFLSTYTGTLPAAAFTPPALIKGITSPAESYGDPKSASGKSSRTTLSMFDISPAVLAFSVMEGQPDPPEQAVAIANIGAGELFWHIQSDGSSLSWLRMNATEGSLAGGQITQIVLHVSDAGLIVGTYRVDVLTSALDSSGTLSAGSPQTFNVELDILPASNFESE